MSQMASSRRFAVAAVALVATLAAACGGGDDDAASAASPPPAGTAGAGDTAGAGSESAGAARATASASAGPGASEPVPGATGAPATGSTGEPLATTEGSSPFVKLEILDLRRVHETVTLEYAITTDDTQTITTVDIFAAPEDQFTGGVGATSPKRELLSGVTLVDQINRKRHLVLRDAQGECLCTRWDQARSETRYIHSAQFPAPPPDVTTMTVQVPRFPAIDNVPLRSAG